MHTANSKASVVRALRCFVGRHAMPVEVLADLTGINAKTVYAHMHPDGSCPDFDQIRAYGRALGAQFMNMLLSSDGFAVLGVEPQPYCMHGAMTRLLDAGHKWSVIIEDNRITHDEEPIAVPLWRSLGTFGFEYAAAIERRIAA